MGFDTIHETSIADIVGIMKTGLSVANDRFNKPKGSGIVYSSSLTKATKGLVMEFPVLISKANNIESAGIVAKAYEAKFVTMLQLAFAACNLTNSQDGFEFLKDFHTNLDFKDFTVDNFIDSMNTIASSMKESGQITADSYAQYKAITEDMKNLCYYFDEDIKESSLNNYKVMNNYGNLKVVKEAILPGVDPSGDIDKRIDAFGKNQKNDNTDSDTINSNIDNAEKASRANSAQQSDDKKAEDDNIRQNARDARETEKLNLDKNKFDMDQKRGAAKDDLDLAKFRQSAIQNQILTTDIKKANELVPTMMVVNFIYLDKETQAQVHRQIIIGVKAKLYEVEPYDVITKIITKNVDSNVMLKFVKVSTREVSFVKDFLLAIDDAKLDALSKSKRGSANKLFKVLERRAVKGKIRQSLKMKDYSKAISSLVISQEEAEELLKNNIDVNDPRIIRPIMEKLNLISFAIIDESSESVKFLFDTGDDVYETIPLSKLEKEQRDGMSKKVINLMAKMNR